MTPLVFVDTPVFLRTADDRDLAKQARAREWVRWCWEARAGRVSTQVLNELYHNAITRFRARMPVQQARTQVRDLRRFGATSADLCYAAAGRVDAYFEENLGPWDIAAGELIAREAGCRTGGLDGGKARPSTLLAAAPGIFEPLRDLIARIDADLAAGRSAAVQPNR